MSTWTGNLRILMPVFNDWVAVARLLAQLDAVLERHRLEARVLLVNDASTEPMPEPRSAARSTRGACVVPYHAVSTSSVE